jgi:hypothetical protein
VLASDDFWNRVSGVSGFRERLLTATLVLSRLMNEQSGAELERIRREATVLFDDGTPQPRSTCASAAQEVSGEEPAKSHHGPRSGPDFSRLWAIVDSNHGPPPYQSGALTN